MGRESLAVRGVFKMHVLYYTLHTLYTKHDADVAGRGGGDSDASWRSAH